MFLTRPVFSVRADTPDKRDLICKFSGSGLGDVKSTVDLRKWCSPIEDQLNLGSCVGQAIVGAYELMLNKFYPNKFIDLSRLFVYYNARLIDGPEYLDEDVGTYIRSGIKSVQKWGVCAETVWPYLVENFDDAPSIQSYEDAEQRIIKKYYRVIGNDNIVHALNNEYPVIISIYVYENFYDLENSNQSTLTPPNNSKFMGGHAVTIVGYDLDKRLFLVRNSFGENWGDKGYFWMPFDYAEAELLDSWIFDIEIDHDK
jgi:C1A family cysteine protease